jgi:hypothetical protein
VVLVGDRRVARVEARKVAKAAGREVEAGVGAVRVVEAVRAQAAARRVGREALGADRVVRGAVRRVTEAVAASSGSNA